MQTIETVRELSKTPDRAAREHLLIEAFQRGNRELFEGLRIVLDPLAQLSVEKVPAIDAEDDEESDFTPNEFFQLVNQLRAGGKNDLIEDAAQRAPVTLWNTFYRRILLGDLRIGVTSVMVNRVMKRLSGEHPDTARYLIPRYSCQRAHEAPSFDASSMAAGTMMLDIHQSGQRVVIAISDRVTIMDDNANKLVLPLITSMLETLSTHLPGGIVLDGIIRHKDGPEAFRKALRRIELQADLTLALIDIVPLSAFSAGYCAHSTATRHSALSALEMTGMLNTISNGTISIVPKRTIDFNSPDGKESFEEFRQHALSVGAQKIVLKDADAPYIAGKSSAWTCVPL